MRATPRRALRRCLPRAGTTRLRHAPPGGAAGCSLRRRALSTWPRRRSTPRLRRSSLRRQRRRPRPLTTAQRRRSRRRLRKSATAGAGGKAPESELSAADARPAAASALTQTPAELAGPRAASAAAADAASEALLQLWTPRRALRRTLRRQRRAPNATRPLRPTKLPLRCCGRSQSHRSCTCAHSVAHADRIAAAARRSRVCYAIAATAERRAVIAERLVVG